MTEEVMNAYIDKYGQPPNHPNHLLQFSKSRRDLPNLNYSSSRQAIADWERAKRKKKKKKEKKERKKKEKKQPSLKSSKSTPPTIGTNKSGGGWVANPDPDRRSPAINQSPITINHSASPRSVTPEPMSGSYHNDDYKEQHNANSHSSNEPEITEMNEEDERQQYGGANQEHRHKTVVIDNGTSLMKVGYVGDQAPIAQFHPTQISKGRQLQKNPISRGIITDTNMIEAVYSNAFHNTLQLGRDELSDFGVILNCAVFCPQDTAEQLCEIMMEGFGFSKFYICCSALLSLYGTQKVSGLVIESGSSLTQCVPIWNGCPVAQACKRVDVGGDDVDEYLRDLLRTSHKNLTETQLTTAICKQIKEAHGYIALDYRKEKSKRIEYQLPSGKTIKIGDERFKCGELLFSYLDRNSIDKQIYDSVMSCDVDIRKEMLSNIVISGGSTLFKGMQSRIKNDLVESCKTSKTKKMKKYAKKVNIMTPANRDVLSWCGGSIFGALPAFEQFWFTREDYQEKGAILSQKIEHSNIFFYDDYQPKELDLQEIQNYNQQYRRRTLSVYTYTGSMATPTLKTGSLLGGGGDPVFPDKKKSNPFPHISPGFGAENPFNSARNILPKGGRVPPKKPPPNIPIKDIQKPKRTLGPIQMEANHNAAPPQTNEVEPDEDDLVKTYSEPWNDEPDDAWDPTKMAAAYDRPRERSRAVQSGKKASDRVNLQAHTPEVDPETPEPKSYDDPSAAMAAAVDKYENSENERKLREELRALSNQYDEALLQVEELKLENDMLEKQNDALLQENKLLKHKGKRFDNESRTMQTAKAAVVKEKNQIIANTAQIAQEIANIRQMFTNGTNRLQRINFDYLYNPQNARTVENITD